MKMNKWLMMAAAGMILFSSCEDKDPDNVNDVDISGKNNKEVLMIQPWAFYSYSQKINNNTVDAMDACQKDDIFVFKANDICEVRNNAMKCNQADPETFETAWSMPTPTGNIVNFLGFDFTLKTKTNSAVVLEREWENRTGDIVFEKLELRAAK